MAAKSSPKSFASAAAWRAWLLKHHARETELLVRCFRVEFATRGATYKEALDEALCFGWIDGVRKSLDAESFTVRFTPRKPGSRWSLVNTKRANELEAEGRMHASGLAAFRARDAKDTRRYSFESRDREFSPDLVRRFRADKRAWAFFEGRPPGEKKLAKFYVMSAKQPETQLRRLERVIATFARGLPLRSLMGPASQKPS